MIYSMTGLGSGVVEGELGRLAVTVRSVNSRFFDLVVRCPGRLAACENAVRQAVQDRLSRGKVTVHIDWEQAVAEASLPQLDEAVAQRYLAEMERLAALAGQEGVADVGRVASLPGVFRTAEPSVDLEAVQADLLAATEAALADYDQMRRAEGEALLRDLTARLDALDGLIDRVEAAGAAEREAMPRRLRAKLEELLRPGEVDPDRLAMEVALLAERGDITEEFVRFRSHNAQYRAALEKGGDVGKRLNFLLQEMNREANTIASKSTASDAVHLAVEIKEEVERLREQIQNLA